MKNIRNDIMPALFTLCRTLRHGRDLLVRVGIKGITACLQVMS